MTKHSYKHLVFLLPILLFSITTAEIAIDVGVVLDSQYPVVKGWLASISIALEDFYAKHTNYATKLVLHHHDSNTSIIGATSATLNLMRNVGVKAIVGPMSSDQAVFMSDLGKIAQVPIISFSATSPSLSSSSGSYFVRTTLNDSFQVGAISALVNQFRWREVVLIYEDTEFGSGIAPYLVDALREVSARVTYRYVIPLSTSDAELENKMKTLMSMRTRVFVVHMVPPLGIKFFSKANELGMLGDGYIWIMTDSLTESFDTIDTLVASKMRGVLGVKPLVPWSKEIDDFRKRWKARFSSPKEESTLTSFDMWAYDTIWALAMAVEESGDLQGIETGNSTSNLPNLKVSSNGPKLLSAIHRTNFKGLSGRFQLLEGQLEASLFELTNVGRNGLERIGYWTTANGISRYSHSKYKIDDHEWPENLQNQPRGWEWPTRGKKLRIGVPLVDGFPGFADIHYDEERKGIVAEGFCIEVFEAAIAKLPYEVPREYILYVNSSGNSNGSYDDLIQEVYHQRFDALVGDITIWSARTKYVDFTTPYTESGVMMVVPTNREPSFKLFEFLEPMTMELWLASGAAFIFTGFMIWLMEHRKNEAFHGTLSQQLGTTLYFIFSTLVFSHRERLTSNFSKVALIMWVFVVLILTSSYTASLSSLLTSEQLTSDITSVEDLLHNKHNVGYLGGSIVKSILVQIGFNDSNLMVYSSLAEYHMGLSKGSSGGGVSAIFDEVPYIKVFLSKHPSEYMVVGPSYKTNGFGFVFPRGFPLLPDVSRAILSVKESNQMLELEKNLYGELFHGPLTAIQESGTNGLNRLPLLRFLGLFLITGVTSVGALLLHFTGRVSKLVEDAVEYVHARLLRILLEIINARPRIFPRIR